MRPMGDSLTVFGSRLGFAWDPSNLGSYLIRHTDHPGLPIHIHAGIQVGNRIIQLPLTNEGEQFKFLDQGMTPTSMSLSGIDPETGLHIKLTLRIPFRPRDYNFSTTPAIFFELEIDKILMAFRWDPEPEPEVEGKIFLWFSGEGFDFQPRDKDLSIRYQTHPIMPREMTASEKIEKTYDSILEGGRRQGTELDIETKYCEDSLVALEGYWQNNRMEAPFVLKPGMKGPHLAAVWCVYDSPVFNVLGDRCRFKYTDNFKSLDSVERWVRQNYKAVVSNSEKVDNLILSSGLGESVNHLLSQTLHSWLMDSWMVVRPNGQDWYTVWEGTCYFLSTTDVEYTMTPFYLTLWPELLELELNEWSLFGNDGRKCLGERGIHTLYLSHDIGLRCGGIGQMYDHDMEVEESANYLLMAFSHWRRTGRSEAIRKNEIFIRKLMDFILACDTTGNGLLDKGCVNTIDDASPAVQFGSEQIYLGVKAMMAIKAGQEILTFIGSSTMEGYQQFVNRGLKTIESSGWKDDHYIVTLTKTMDGLMDPWSGEPMQGELEGWDAYHIYTENGLALTDMVGFESGLDNERLCQDIITSSAATLGKYGCRHTSYVNEKTIESNIQGIISSGTKVGWISMNMLRDMAAAYRGIDLLSLADRYWDYQVLTNGDKFTGFFETFYGNNLHWYPRGVAVFGYLDAAVGFSYDAVLTTKKIKPVRASLTVPLLLFADWEKGTAPQVVTYLKNQVIEFSVDW